MKCLQNISEGYGFQARIFETPKVEQRLVPSEKFAKNIKFESFCLKINLLGEW